MQHLYSKIKGYAGHLITTRPSNNPKGLGRRNSHNTKSNFTFQGNIEKQRLEKHKNRMHGGCA